MSSKHKQRRLSKNKKPTKPQSSKARHPHPHTHPRPSTASDRNIDNSTAQSNGFHRKSNFNHGHSTLNYPHCQTFSFVSFDDVLRRLSRTSHNGCHLNSCGAVHADIVPSRRQSDFVRFTIHLGDMSLNDHQLAQLTEQKIIPLLDAFLAEKRSTVAGSEAGALQRVVIAVYLNQNCLRGHGLLPILNYILTRDFRLLTLQLFRNCIDDEGCAQLMSVVRQLKYPPNEMHISHNKVSTAGFNAIVDMLHYRREHRHQLLSYPMRCYQMPHHAQHTIQSRVPLWLRVENNQIDVEAATLYMQRQRITHCLARNLSSRMHNKSKSKPKKQTAAAAGAVESMAFYCHSHACVPETIAATYARSAAVVSVSVAANGGDGGPCKHCENMRRQQQQKQKRNHSRKIVVCKNCIKKARLIEQLERDEQSEQTQHDDGHKEDEAEADELDDVVKAVDAIDNNGSLSVNQKIAAMERLSERLQERQERETEREKAKEKEEEEEEEEVVDVDDDDGVADANGQECRDARALEKERWQAAVCEVPPGYEIPMVHLHKFEDQLKQAVTNSKVLMAIGDDDDEELEEEKSDDKLDSKADSGGGTSSSSSSSLEEEEEEEEDDEDDDDEPVVHDEDVTGQKDQKKPEASDAKASSFDSDDGKSATAKVSAILPIIQQQQATDVHFKSEQGNIRQQYEESLLRNSETPLFIMCDTCSILRMVALKKKSAMNYWETMLTQKQKMEYVLRLSQRRVVTSEKRHLTTSGAYQRWLRMEVLPSLKVHLATEEVKQLADKLCRTTYTQKRHNASQFEPYTPRHLDILKCQIYRFVALCPHKIPKSDSDRHAWQQVIQKHIFHEIGYECPPDLVSTFITETRKLVKQYLHQKEVENAKLFTLNTLIDKSQHGDFGFNSTLKQEQSCLLIPHTVTQELEHIKTTGLTRGNKSKGDLWRVQQLCGSGGLLEVLCKQSGCDILGSEHGEAHLTFRHGNNDYTIISVAEYYSKLLNNDRNLGFVLLTNDKAMYTIASGKGVPVVSLNTLNDHLQTQSAQNEWTASYLRANFIKCGFVGGFARKHLVQDAVQTLNANAKTSEVWKPKAQALARARPVATVETVETVERELQTDEERTVQQQQPAVDPAVMQQMVDELLFRRQQISAHMEMEQAHIAQLDVANKLTALLLSALTQTQQQKSASMSVSKPEKDQVEDETENADDDDKMQKVTAMVQQAQFVWSQFICEFQQRNNHNEAPTSMTTTTTEATTATTAVEPELTLETVPESRETTARNSDADSDASSMEPEPLNAEEQARLLAMQESLASVHSVAKHTTQVLELPPVPPPLSSVPSSSHISKTPWPSSELLKTFDCASRANLGTSHELLLSHDQHSANATKCTPLGADSDGVLVAGWELFQQQCTSGVNGQYVEEEIQM